jgi:hypothetical protein
MTTLHDLIGAESLLVAYWRRKNNRGQKEVPTPDEFTTMVELLIENEETRCRPTIQSTPPMDLGPS